MHQRILNVREEASLNSFETHMESVHHGILQQEQTSRGDLFRRGESSGEHAIPLHGVFEILNPVSGLHERGDD
jgi:hypothetical protein